MDYMGRLLSGIACNSAFDHGPFMYNLIILELLWEGPVEYAEEQFADKIYC